MRRPDLRLAGGVGPWRAAGDPVVQPAKLGGGKRLGFLRRHRLPVVVVATGGEVERALLRPAGDEARLGAVTADQSLGARAEVETSLELGLVLPVAGEALLPQQGRHAPHEQRLGVGRGYRRRRGRRECGEQDEAAGRGHGMSEVIRGRRAMARCAA